MDDKDSPPLSGQDNPETSPLSTPPKGEDLKEAKDKPALKISKRIFVVTCTKESLTREVMDCLNRNCLEYVLSFDRAYSTLSIEQKFIQNPGIQFAIVSLSGDEFVYPKEGKCQNAKLRAKQDIVFELGFLVGKLGRQNVFVLYHEQKSFLLPTNFLHVLYYPRDEKGRWKDELLKRLKTAGFALRDNV